MKIDKNTLDVLKSFASINPSIIVRPGNEIRTLSPQKTVIAKAVIPFEFEKGFCIYDLTQFLPAVSLFENPDFEFGDKSVRISDEKSSVSYTYASEDMVREAPQKDIALPDVVVEFRLSQETIRATMQAASILQLPNWTVVGDGKEVAIVVSNPDNDSSNNFRYVVGETDKVFDLVFRVENLKFMPNAYTVQISSKGISHFKTDDEKLQYWIATETRK